MVDYLTDLVRGDYIREISMRNQRHNVEITEQKAEVTSKAPKSRKSPRQDGLHNEILKYGGQRFIQELAKSTKF